MEQLFAGRETDRRCIYKRHQCIHSISERASGRRNFVWPDSILAFGRPKTLHPALQAFR